MKNLSKQRKNGIPYSKFSVVAPLLSLSPIIYFFTSYILTFDGSQSLSFTLLALELYVVSCPLILILTCLPLAGAAIGLVGLFDIKKHRLRGKWLAVFAIVVGLATIYYFISLTVFVFGFGRI